MCVSVHAASLCECAVDHSIVMYLMGPDGQFIEFFTQLADVPEIVDRMAKILKESKQ